VSVSVRTELAMWLSCACVLCALLQEAAAAARVAGSAHTTCTAC
jgi:hypothetical protein